MIPQDTAYFYLNSANEIVMRVQWVTTPSTVVYVKPDGTQAAGSGFPAADDATAFTLYADGTLESYRHIGGDGSFTWLKFAQAAPGEGKVFGPNSEYRHGDLIYSETMTPDLARTVQTYLDGNVITYAFYYGMRETSSVVLTGTYEPATGISTVSLKNLANSMPITMTGPGYINSLNGLGAGLIGNDGSTLIGNDGSTLVGNDGASLIGNDGSTLSLLDVASLISDAGWTLIGNDGSTLINLAGGPNSVVSPAYIFDAGRLVGNDGASLVGLEGVAVAANAMAVFRGYSAYSLTSFEDDVDPPVDAIAADVTTTVEADLFGNFSGELETAGDRDWVKVDLRAGETYVIRANGADTGDGSLGNPVVRLYDANGTLVAEDDDSGTGANGRLTVTAEFDGLYFVEAASSDDTGVGTYEIGVHRQATAFIKDGATIDMGHGGFPDGTSIVALSDGSLAIGFTTRFDGQQADGAHVYVSHANVAIIDAAGQWMDLDSRPEYTTFYMPRPGDGNARQPGPAQLVAGEDGMFSIIVANTWSLPWSSSTSAEVAYGSVLGLGPGRPITAQDSSGSFGGSPNNPSGAVDIAMLANGKYIASLSGGAAPGSEIANDTVVQVSINGAMPVPIDDSGVRWDHQQTSVSALGKGAVVVWTDAAADPPGSHSAGTGVMGAILDASGNVQHMFKVNQTEVRAQWVGSAQAVAELADGGFVVAWMGSEDDPNYALPYNDSYFRVFNADGTPRSAEIVIGSNTGGEQARPMVLGLPGGGFAVSWVGNGFPDNIRLQQFDDDGNKIGPEAGVGRGGGQSMTVAPDGKIAIAYLGDGLLRVQVMEPNLAPTDILLSSNTIAEDVPDPYNTRIGTLSAVDANASDFFTYELIDNADGFFRLAGTDIYWNKSGTQPDHETQSSYEIEVKVTDSAQVSFTKSLTIRVTGIGGNEYPVIEGGSSVVANVKENAAAVKTIVASDLDSDPLTYSISGGSDAELFDIVTANGKTELVFKTAPDFENPRDVDSDNAYDVIIRADDGKGGFYNQAVTVQVENEAGIVFKGTSKADKKNGTGEEDILSGKAKDDKLDGKGGDDTLNGGTGNDTLIGGKGKDIFIFDTALNAKTNVDKIVGFSVTDDLFHLAASTFKKIGALGVLAEDAFVANTSGKAADKHDRIIYDVDSGKLYYDADGSKTKSDAVLFATLDKNLDLTGADFMAI